jgi:hypothetical protein
VKYFSISRIYIFLTATTKPVIFSKGMLFSPFFGRIYRMIRICIYSGRHRGAKAQRHKGKGAKGQRGKEKMKTYRDLLVWQKSMTLSYMN